jgi:hypothetical protein
MYHAVMTQAEELPTISDEELAALIAGWKKRSQPARPRIRGLRVPALPSGPLLAQVLGAVAVEAGVFMQWGMSITLLVGGAAAALLGALREAGKV